MNRFVALAMLMVVGLCASAAAQGVPQSVKVQGYLSDKAGGSPVPATGVYTMTFEIFDTAVGGIAIAAVGPLPVTVTNGVYEATLPSGAGAFAGAVRFLQITVNGEVLTPRLAIDSTPYALRSESAIKAETVAPGSVGAAGLAPLAVTAPAIADGAVTGPKIGVPCADGQILVRVGGLWTCGVIPPAPRVCADGAFLSCYPAPTSTLGVGPCKAGTSSCKPDHTGFTDCDGAVVPAEEACDGVDNDCDGTVDEGDACGGGSCGNGVLDAGEACDDANTNAGDGCSALCQVEPGYQCTGSPSVCTTTCGDGIVSGGEQCDGADLGGQTCQSQGFSGGSLSCNPDCTLNLSACSGGGCVDADADGFPSNSCGGLDCNDSNAAIHPGAIESCNGVDDDCDALVDEGGVCGGLCGNGLINAGEQCDGANLGGQSCQSLGFAAGSLSCNPNCTLNTSGCTSGCVDADADGYPSAACGGPDCNDSNAAVNPGAPEQCDALDNDCDGQVDEGGACGVACGNGSVEAGEACDDGNLVPGDGCSGACQVEAGFQCTGSPSVCTTTCGDGILSGAEPCDGANLGGHTCQQLGYTGGSLACNGNCTLNTTGCTGCADADADGFTASACGGLDCNDSNAAIHPGAIEFCNGVDDDCDALVDEGGACGGLCGNGLINPGEQCDGTDFGGQTCVSYGFPGGTLSCNPDCTVNTTACSGGGCQDADSDGFTNATCGGGDCDDTNAAVNPAAVEVCDGVDNDCDALVDEDGACGGCQDADGDGFIDAACGGNDCDDTRAQVYPGAPELCDGVDNDCDTQVDEGGACDPVLCGNGVINAGEQCDGASLGGNSCASLGFAGGSLACSPDCTLDTGGCTGCADADRDGFPASACGGNDCNDANAAVHPGAIELCDGVDNDCDAQVDEGGACGSATCGDGIIAGLEACDDGNTNPGDGCSTTCQVEAGFQCTGSPSTCAAVCGDGLVRGGESCDGADFNGQSCQSLGFSGGSLACNADCTLDVGSCTP